MNESEQTGRAATNEGIQQYYHTKIDELQVRTSGGDHWNWLNTFT